MKTVCVLALLLALTGCGTLSNLVSAGAKINDSAAEAAEVTICRSISVGAWIRAYGSDPEKAKAWRALCSEQIGEMP